jgi:WS/DGAT/MGAT family acyltransferase
MIQSLNGLDAAFLHLETPSAPLHVAQVCVFDPASTSPFSFERVRALIEARLERLAPFRRRLVTTPLALGHPVWADDPDFELDWHVRPARLPEPGGTDELESFTEEFVGQTLDRSRPLWEMRVVDGLEDGMVAAVAKVHHSAVDGISGAELTANLLDLEPDPPPDPPPAEWSPERLPGPVRMLRRAVASGLAQPATTARASMAIGAAAWRVRQLNRSDRVAGPPPPIGAPVTVLNGAVGAGRQICFAHLDLADVQLVRDASGATVNEVLLATCGGALRSFLHDADAEPDGDLVAAVPVSVRTDDLQPMGNRLSIMLVGLATTAQDPRTRLARIIDGSRRAKTQDRAIGPDTLACAAAAWPPMLGPGLGRAFARLQPLLARRPVFNVVVSSFPGPPFPLYCAGARLVAPYPIGPLLGGSALNITVQTYLDALHVGINLDPDTVPHGDHLPGLLREALDELVKVCS